MNFVSFARSGTSVVTTADAVAVLVLSICFPLARLLLQRYLFEPACQLVLAWRSQSQAKLWKDGLRSPTQKLCESQWKLFTYVCFSLIGATCLQEDWAADSAQLYNDWPLQQISGTMRQLYRLELAYYLSSIGMLALWEIPRKDSTVMMIHHIATVVLIGASFFCNLFRVGCITMILHDATDVVMELSKNFKYLKLEAAAACTFAAFTAAWVVLRLYLFPAYVIRSFVLEAPEIIGERPPLYWLLSSLLGTLFFLHLYWFVFIVQIAWLGLTTGTGRDLRENDE